MLQLFVIASVVIFAPIFRYVGGFVPYLPLCARVNMPLCCRVGCLSAPKALYLLQKFVFNVTIISRREIYFGTHTACQVERVGFFGTARNGDSAVVVLHAVGGA